MIETKTRPEIAGVLLCMEVDQGKIHPGISLITLAPGMVVGSVPAAIRLQVLVASFAPAGTRAEFTLRVVEPTGASALVRKTEVKYKDGETVKYLTMPITGTAPRAGIYYVVVSIGDEALARVPFSVELRP